MVTPQEIELKEFSRSVRGYDRDEVDEFLDLIILDMQDLLNNLEALKNENEELKLEIEEHKKSQKKVMDTLESAKTLMKDMSDSAEKRADIIIQNAKRDADLILRNARESVPHSAEINADSDLHDKIMLFRSKYRQLLKDELENLDNKSDDLLSELEKEFMPTSFDTQVFEFSDIADDELKVPVKEETSSDNKTYHEMTDTQYLDPDEIIKQLENEAKSFQDSSQVEEKKKPSPLAKDTVVLDANAIDEMIAKTKAEVEEDF